MSLARPSEIWMTAIGKKLRDKKVGLPHLADVSERVASAVCFQMLTAKVFVFNEKLGQENRKQGMQMVPLCLTYCKTIKK